MGKNMLKLDIKGFEEYLERLDKAGKDIKEITEKALTQAGKKIGEDTHKAVEKSNLPAKGKYSKGNTEKSIVDNPKVEWDGMTASIGVGFDFNKQGAGGYLITGTPKMKPDQQLKRMYKGKKYMSDIKTDMTNLFENELGRRL